MGFPVSLLVGKARRVVREDCPVVRPRWGSRSVVGRLLPAGRQAKEPRLSCLLHVGTVPPERRVGRTAGCERRPDAVVGCHAAPAGAWDRSVAATAGSHVKTLKAKGQAATLRVQTAMVRTGETRLQGSRSSLNSNCQKNRRKLSSPTAIAEALQGRRQRFPRVRRVIRLGNSEVRAKNRSDSTCFSTVACKHPMNSEDLPAIAVEIACITP